MVEDLIGSSILLGKTRSGIEEILGPPDHREALWYGYKVHTIPRCHFWECRLDIVFEFEEVQFRDDVQFGVTSVAVND
jgi:hypothetical protein